MYLFVKKKKKVLGWAYSKESKHPCPNGLPSPQPLLALKTCLKIKPFPDQRSLVMHRGCKRARFGPMSCADLVDILHWANSRFWFCQIQAQPCTTLIITAKIEHKIGRAWALSDPTPWKRTQKFRVQIKIGNPNNWWVGLRHAVQPTCLCEAEAEAESTLVWPVNLKFRLAFQMDPIGLHLLP